MSKLRVHGFTLSLTATAPDRTRTLIVLSASAATSCINGPSPHGPFNKCLAPMAAPPELTTEFAARGFENIGAWIMGRNMFGPVRGPWPDDSWKGRWGDNPPYHTPVFVLTNHPRASFTMSGGTTFHFVTDGIHAALRRATEAANGQDVRLGGGVATIRNICSPTC